MRRLTTVVGAVGAALLLATSPAMAEPSPAAAAPPPAGKKMCAIADPKLAFALGWHPRIPLRDGIRRYARWFHTAAK